MLLTVSLRYFGNTLDINNQRVPHLEPNTRQPSLCPRLPGPLDTQTLTWQQQHTIQKQCSEESGCEASSWLDESADTFSSIRPNPVYKRGWGKGRGRRKKAEVAQEASGPGYSQDILEQRRT